MLKIILSVSFLLFIPAVTSAATIHGVDVPNECLASLAVKPNALITNLSGFALWKSLEGERCETVELTREKLFVQGIAQPDDVIRLMTSGVQSWINELEQKKSEVERDLANAQGSTEVAGDIINSAIGAKVGTVSAILGCAGSGWGCAIGAISAMSGIFSVSKDISKGVDWTNNMKILRNRLKETIDKLAVARTELENLPKDEIKERAKRATESFVEMCQLVKSNCK